MVAQEGVDGRSERISVSPSRRGDFGCGIAFQPLVHLGRQEAYPTTRALM